MPEENSLSTDNLSSETPNVPPPTREKILSTTPRRRVYLLVLGILIFAIVITLVGLWLVGNRENSSDTSVLTANPTAIPTPAVNGSLEPPALYPEFEWEEVSEDDSYWLRNDPSAVSALYFDFESVNIPLSGTEWHYESGTVDSLKELDGIRSGFENYYGKALTRLGWNNTIEYSGKTLQAIAADGAGGGTIGKIKIAGSQMRLIILQTQTDEPTRPTVSCPCTIDFNVFVSDIFSTVDLTN